MPLSVLRNAQIGFTSNLYYGQSFAPFLVSSILPGIDVCGPPFLQSRGTATSAQLMSDDNDIGFAPHVSGENSSVSSGIPLASSLSQLSTYKQSGSLNHELEQTKRTVKSFLRSSRVTSDGTSSSRTRRPIYASSTPVIKPTTPFNKPHFSTPLPISNKIALLETTQSSESSPSCESNILPADRFLQHFSRYNPPPPSSLLSELRSNPMEISERSSEVLRTYARRMSSRKVERELAEMMRLERVGPLMGTRRDVGRRRRAHNPVSNSDSVKRHRSGSFDRGRSLLMERISKLEELWRPPSDYVEEFPDSGEDDIYDSSVILEKEVDTNERRTSLAQAGASSKQEFTRRANKLLIHRYPPIAQLPSESSLTIRLGYIHQHLLTKGVEDPFVGLEAALAFVTPSSVHSLSSWKRSSEGQSTLLAVLHLYLGYLRHRIPAKTERGSRTPPAPSAQSVALYHTSSVDQELATRTLSLDLLDHFVHLHPHVRPTKQTLHLVCSSEFPRGTLQTTAAPPTSKSSTPPKTRTAVVHAISLVFRTRWGISPGHETWRLLARCAIKNHDVKLGHEAWKGWYTSRQSELSAKSMDHALTDRNVKSESVKIRFRHFGRGLVRWLRILKGFRKKGWIRRLKVGERRKYVWVGEGMGEHDIEEQSGQIGDQCGGLSGVSKIS